MKPLPESVKKVIEAKTHAHFVTPMPDGSPQVARRGSTQTVTSTWSPPLWVYAAMVVLLIVGFAGGYTVKRPSASKP